MQHRACSFETRSALSAVKMRFLKGQYQYNTERHFCFELILLNLTRAVRLLNLMLRSFDVRSALSVALGAVKVLLHSFDVSSTMSVALGAVKVSFRF